MLGCVPKQRVSVGLVGACSPGAMPRPVLDGLQWGTPVCITSRQPDHKMPYTWGHPPAAAPACRAAWPSWVLPAAGMHRGAPPLAGMIPG